MKVLMIMPLLAALLLVSACQNQTHANILRKCTVLGDESIMYARANYVKLFHYFNPQKFSEPFEQVKDFDHRVHRNTINTYYDTIHKLKSGDEVTKGLISACKDLAEFSTRFVDQSYPRAISHQSSHDKLSDNFFIEINQIVKFDHNIGTFDQSEKSFKQHILSYQKAVINYIKKHHKRLPSELIANFGFNKT